MYTKTSKFINILLFSALAVLGLYFGVRTLLPLFMPFILAFAAALAVEPAVRALSSSRLIPRGAAAGLCLALFLALVAAILKLVCGRLAVEGRALLERLPEFLEGASALLSSLERRLARFTDGMSGALDGYLRNALAALEERARLLPAELSGRLLGYVSRLASKAPSVLLFAATWIMGAYFISASYVELRGFLSHRLPKTWLSKLTETASVLRRTLGRWLRAQLIMTLIVFVFLFAGFLLMRMEYALLPALLTALVDALPVLGAGTVLVPWALGEFLLGEYARGVGLLVCYGLLTVLRSCLQAKLLGDSLGLHPLTALAAIYFGFTLCGVWGMLLFPILAITVKQLNDSGVISLWRTGRTPHAENGG